MDISQKIDVKQTQKLALTQQLVQSIEMLLLSNVELAEKISAEMVDNPVLEEENVAVLPSSNDEDRNLLSSVGKELSGDKTLLQRKEDRDTFYEESGNSAYYGNHDNDRKRSFIENAVTQKETLKEHLAGQASLVAKDEKELMLLESVITSIEDNGFLIVEAEEIAKDLSVDIEKIADAISIVQNFDPIGCAVKGVQESLIIQTQQVYPEDEILLQILLSYFLDLEKLNYTKIARALHITTLEVIRKSRLVHNLEPYPGVKYSSKKIKYIIPDIEVKHVDGEIIININDDWIPSIRINSYYNNILKQKSIDKQLTGYLKDKLQSANYLLKSIASRRETIIKVVNAIMEYQQKFLIKGPGHLKPLVYADIAMEVGMHESTISRVANNKFVQTQWGVFQLKHFFVSKLKSYNLEDHSSEEIMNLITEIVNNENPEHPVSDGEILKELQRRGINIARRTIAKYRAILNISPSNTRKKLNFINNEGNK